MKIEDVAAACVKRLLWKRIEPTIADIYVFLLLHLRLTVHWRGFATTLANSLSMYKEKFRQKTGLTLLNAVGAEDCTDGLELTDKFNELVCHGCHNIT